MKKDFWTTSRTSREAIDRLDYFHDPEALDKKNELEGMKIACDAIMILGERYAAYARELAEKESDQNAGKSCFKSLPTATSCQRISPRLTGRQFRCTGSCILGVTSELNPWDAYSPGRLDQHLNPFYERDVESGILDDEKALELLECLWVKFNNQPAPRRLE